MRDLVIASVTDIAPAKIIATTNGAGADLTGYDGAELVLNAGVITDGTHTPAVEDSPDNSTWTAVPAANLIGAFTQLTSASGGSAAQSVGYIGGNRYVRVSVTVAGATNGGIYGTEIVRGYAALKSG
jgi:hypothetical protein